MISIEESDKRLLKRIIDIARIIYDDDITHGYSHALRVLALSLMIAEEIKENVDVFVLASSAILHDIGRNSCNEHHALCAANFSETILEALGVPSDRRSKIRKAIETHSFSLKRKPSSIEARILSDADKLDALGAIGIARVFNYSGRESRSLEESLIHFKEKILRLPSHLYTEPAKKMAAERISIVEEFVNRIQSEVKEAEAFLTNFFSDG
jgi:uncharacterized protein